MKKILTVILLALALAPVGLAQYGTPTGKKWNPYINNWDYYMGPNDIGWYKWLRLYDTNQSHYLSIKWNENDTAHRTLNLVLGGTDRTLTLSGSATFGDWFDQSVKATSSPTFAGLTVSSLTSTRIPIAGTAGLLGDDADLTFSGDTLMATKMLSAIPVVTKSGDAVLSAAECNSIVYATATATITLPDTAGLAVGTWVTVVSTTAAAVHVNPNDADLLIVDGVAYTAGQKASSSSGAGDLITLQYYTAGKWMMTGRSGTWTNGG